MRISPIDMNLVTRVSGITAEDNRLIGAEVENIASGGESFSEIMARSWENAQASDHTDKISSLELLTGETDDLSALMLDVQKAEMSLNLTLQIRNKMIDAYKEIMQMQV